MSELALRLQQLSQRHQVHEKGDTPMFFSFTQNITDYNPAAFDWVLKTSYEVMLPVAFYLSLFFFMMEVINVVVPKSQAGESLVFKDISFAFMRWLISLALSTIGVVLFVFIVSISTGAINLFNKSGTLTDALLNSFIPQIKLPDNPLSALGQLFGLLTNPGDLISTAVTGVLMYVICLIAQLVAALSVAVIIYLRFFQLYLMAFLSPIPMVSFASREFDSIGKNYLKHGFAYAFQTVVIMAVMWLFSFFAKPTIDLSGTLGIVTGLSAWGAAMGSVVYAIAYVVLIWQTLSVSKRLFGVGV